MGISNKIKVATFANDETKTFIIEIKDMIALPLCNDSKEIYQKVCRTFQSFCLLNYQAKQLDLMENT